MPYSKKKKHGNRMSRKTRCQAEERKKATEIFDVLSTMTESLDNPTSPLETKSGKKLWKVLDGLITDGNQVLKKISEFNLPPVEPCILELTDGGLGVGVSNVEIKFRDAEIALLHNSDRRARVHLATKDSGQNEAERSNACIGEALADDGSLHWWTTNSTTTFMKKM